MKLRNHILLMLTLAFSFQNLNAQFGNIYVRKKFTKQIDSIFYKSVTTWVIPTPFVYNKQYYSVDNGASYLKAGFLGQNLKPNLLNKPGINSNLNIYTSIRIVGLGQMAVLAPYFVIKDINWIAKNDIAQQSTTAHTITKRPPNLWYALGVFITGSITYHLLSKPFIKKALKKHHQYQKLGSLKSDN